MWVWDEKHLLCKHCVATEPTKPSEITTNLIHNMKPKILIAEDNKLTLALYTQGLPSNLCDLKIVRDGEEALIAYKEWKPDIILLDHNMPVLNGYETLKTIRQTLNDKTTIIIMVTSSSDKDDIIACGKLGIQGYVMKPFKTDEIALKIFTLYKSAKKATS